MVSSPQKLGVTQSRSQSLRYLCPVLSRCFPCPLVQVLTSTNFTTPKLQKASQSSFKNSNQKKDMPISDLLVVARLWPLTGIFLIKLNWWIQEITWVFCPRANGITFILSLPSVSLLSTLALLSFSVNVLAFLSVGWPALRGLFCMLLTVSYNCHYFTQRETHCTDLQSSYGGLRLRFTNDIGFSIIQ